MRKLLILVLFLVLSAAILLAVDAPAKKTPNSDRIAELSKAHGEVIAQINQAQEYIQQKQAEALRIEGAISELQRQDAAAEAKNKPAEAPKTEPNK